MKILEELFKLQDLTYKKFTEKLIPNLNEDKIIGVRIPVLRKFSKDFYNSNFDMYCEFIKKLPHDYFEENNLHAMFIENIDDFSKSIEYTKEFLPYIDNWSTCDLFSPKVFKKYPKEVYDHILICINSKETYVVRFAIGVLLSNYLDENFKKEHLELVSNIKSEDYYVKMMIAWYFATALYKQYDFSVKFLENKKLNVWVHNKTIQKAIESRRIDFEKKKYLKTLKLR